MVSSTYSFNDILFVLSHPLFPAYIMNGQGVGSITIDYDIDNTAHDVAADGVVMVSKIRANNGSIAITIQQTSALHAWLKNAFNVLNAAPAFQWAQGVMSIKSVNGFDNATLIGLSILKRASQPYQRQGQEVTWNLKFTNGDTVGTALQAISAVTGRVLS